MSMPLPLNVVIAAETEEAFVCVKKVEGLRVPGISPSYAFAVLTDTKSGKFIPFSGVDHSSIGYWIALDKTAFSRCQSIFHELKSKKGFSRGFYDSHLPEAVVLASNAEELQKTVNFVWEAFCATS